jgi:hypothetical protein
MSHSTTSASPWIFDLILGDDPHVRDFASDSSPTRTAAYVALSPRITDEIGARQQSLNGYREDALSAGQGAVIT